MRNAADAKNLFKATLIFCALIVFAASCIQQAEKLSVPLTAAETPDPVPARASDKIFKAFSHKTAEHKQFECISCHRREGKSLDLEYAGHDSCVGCHLNQFTDKDQQVMCAICHNDMAANPPTMAKFPTRFIESFNVKFDHAEHDNGEGRPPAGCASCHAPAGRGKSIPAGFGAHANCYGCHTAESKIGSCSVCHELGPYARTPQSRYVFKAVFSHGDHSGVGCTDCHDVRRGAPQGRQVTSIAAAQHNCGSVNNCATCHNGSVAFSGDDVLNMASCLRCHVGPSFNMLPGGPCRN